MERGAAPGTRERMRGAPRQSLGRSLCVRHHERRSAARSALDVRRRVSHAAGTSASPARPAREREGWLSMARMNMIQALNSAMHTLMERDPSVVVMGEDVGYFGGV